MGKSWGGLLPFIGDLGTGLNAKRNVGVLHVDCFFLLEAGGLDLVCEDKSLMAAGGHAIYFMDGCLSTKGSPVSESLQRNLQGFQRCPQELGPL